VAPPDQEGTGGAGHHDRSGRRSTRPGTEDVSLQTAFVVDDMAVIAT
jgi:hypothetical protein